MSSVYKNIPSSGYGGRKSKVEGKFPMSPQPKSVLRPKQWNLEVEEAYRFQIAGYRDENEYKLYHTKAEVDRWPESQLVKKLERRDGTYYYYSKERECKEKDVNRTKLYAY